MRALRLLLPLLAALACGDPGDGAPDPRSRGSAGKTPDSVVLVDAASRRVALSRPPRRIVSLVPAASRTLVALGAGARLVGRTDYDSVPPLDTLPSVGGGLHPSLERLVSLNPDLVILFEAGSDRRTPERLDEIGIPRLAVRPDGIDDVRAMIRTLGRAAGAPAAADSLVRRIDAALEAVASRVRDLEPRPVAFVLGGTPPWVAGPGTYIDQLITVAGGRNAFADLGELYGPVSREAFVAREIELLLAVEGAELGLPDLELPLRRVPPGVQSPGPELGTSAWEMARAIHPEAFR